MSNTNEYPLFISKLNNDTGNEIAVNFPAITLTDGADSRIVALPRIASAAPNPSEMLKLSVEVNGENQDLYLSYDYTDGASPTFFLTQVDSNGASSSTEMSGTYDDGDVTLTFNLDGGILIIGTVEVDIEVVLA